VGEDLGTVPDEVRHDMDRLGLARMFVWQYELEPNHDHSLKRVPPGLVASLNTHDMPTFTGFNNGADLNDRFRLGLLSAGEVESEKARRQAGVSRGALALREAGWLSGRPTSRSLLSASLAYLAASAARLVMVNLEDLWLEAEPQNVPGTHRERPNWIRKARYPLETGLGQAVVQKTLKAIDTLRKRSITVDPAQGQKPHPGET
jgi:4-alpha-glucanotransferase